MAMAKGNVKSNIKSKIRRKYNTYLSLRPPDRLSPLKAQVFSLSRWRIFSRVQCSMSIWAFVSAQVSMNLTPNTEKYLSMSEV